MSKNRVLFVDDDPLLLNGLQRALRKMQSEWEMVFASGGEEALQLAAAGPPFDAVITDMRMAVMDGSTLLEEMKRRYPRVLRIILSGQSSKETILRSMTLAHQYLSKPCDIEQLKGVLARAFALRDVMDNPTLAEVASRLKGVPSLPSLYTELMNELQSTNSSIVSVANIIGRDPGMTAKILQIANSALFGLSNVSRIHQAVQLLGLETVKMLVLMVGIFSQFEKGALSEPEMSAICEHSMTVAAIARGIAKIEECSLAMIDETFSAGILHDIGRLVLAAAEPVKYRHVLDDAAARKIPLIVQEYETVGCSHAEVGAYLLGIWGLPPTVVEAVAWHHRPGQSKQHDFGSLACVHVAEVEHNRHSPSHAEQSILLDDEFLIRCGLSEKCADWQKSYEQLKGEE